MTHIDMVYIFPDTTAKTETLFPLAPFFEQLVLLQPVEEPAQESVKNTVPAEEVFPPPLRQMIEQKCVELFCPTPLLDDRDRFLQLLHDVQYRPDDYAGQLSHLSLAGLSGRKETETENSIMNTLLRQTGINANATNTPDNTPEYGKEQEKKQRLMLLWQARLVLKLGEIVDSRQAEIQKSLDTIASREQALLQELRKAGNDGERLVHHAAAMNTSDNLSGAQQRVRLKAWSQLFAYSRCQPPKSVTFITRIRDAFEALMEQYSREYATEAKHLLSLPLPAVMAEKNFIEQRNRFQEDAAELLGLIRDAGKDPLAFEEKRDAWADLWEDLLKQHYPAAENGRCRLSLHSLPEIIPAKFFLDTFAGGETLGLLERSKDSTAATGAVIGIMENIDCQ